MIKKRYYGNDGLNLTWDLGVIFLGIPNSQFGGVKKNFFLDFRLKGATEKCIGCFLVYPFRGLYFS